MEEITKRKGGRNHKVDMETRADVIALLKENNTVRQISNKIYISRNTVLRIAKEEGITPNAGKRGCASGQPKRKYTEEQMRPVVEYAKAHGYANGCRKFNIPESTIHWWSKKRKFSKIVLLIRQCLKKIPGIKNHSMYQISMSAFLWYTIWQKMIIPGYVKDF